MNALTCIMILIMIMIMIKIQSKSMCNSCKPDQCIIIYSYLQTRPALDSWLQKCILNITIIIVCLQLETICRGAVHNFIRELIPMVNNTYKKITRSTFMVGIEYVKFQWVPLVWVIGERVERYKNYSLNCPFSNLKRKIKSLLMLL